MWNPKALVFAGINALIVAGYCLLMTGRLEPLQHEPVANVIAPLTILTVLISAILHPLLSRVDTRIIRMVVLYFGFLLIAALFGLFLWIRFPDGSFLSVPLAVVGGHLYGWPVFLIVLALVLLLGPWLFSAKARD